MELACSYDTQYTSGEELANLGLGPKAKVAPLHGRPDCTFSTIVGGFDTIVFNEDEKVVPVI